MKVDKLSIVRIIVNGHFVIIGLKKNEPVPNKNDIEMKSMNILQNRK